MTTIEKECLVDHEQKMVRIHLEDKKTCNNANANENGIGKIERGQGNGKIEIGTDDGCKCVASNATIIYSSMAIGNPWKMKELAWHRCSCFVWLREQFKLVLYD